MSPAAPRARVSARVLPCVASHVSRFAYLLTSQTEATLAETGLSGFPLATRETPQSRGKVQKMWGGVGVCLPGLEPGHPSQALSSGLSALLHVPPPPTAR